MLIVDIGQSAKDKPGRLMPMPSAQSWPGPAEGEGQSRKLTVALPSVTPTQEKKPPKRHPILPKRPQTRQQEPNEARGGN